MKHGSLSLLRVAVLLFIAALIHALPGRLVAGGGLLKEDPPDDPHFVITDSRSIPIDSLSFGTLPLNTGLVSHNLLVRYRGSGGGGKDGGGNRFGRIIGAELRNNADTVFHVAISTPPDGLIPPQGKQLLAFIDPGQTPGLTPGAKDAELMLLFEMIDDQGRPKGLDSAKLRLHVVIEQRSGQGTVYPAQVSIPSETVAVGGKFNLRLVLDSIPTPMPPTGFRCTIAFNASLALPIDSMLGLRVNNNGEAVLDLRSDMFPPPTSFGAGAVLLSIPMMALLGNARSTELAIRDFRWNDPGMVNPVQVSGDLTIADIYTDSGAVYTDGGRPRLVNGNTGELRLAVVPDLLKTDALITATYGTFATLKVFDLAGVEVYDLSRALPPSNGTPVTIPISISRDKFFSPGTYLIRLSVPGASLTRMIIVE